MEYKTGTAPPTTPPPPPYGKPVTGFLVNTPNPPPQNHPSTQAEWSTGLCHYSSDWLLWCITCWCRCITFGQIAEIVDKGSPPCVVSGGLYSLLQYMTGCAGGRLYSGIYRSKMRKQYMLPERPCGDCLVHCCCEPCALRQEYRELQNRGFDMSIGWVGNMERQNRGVEMAPAVQGGMTR